MRPKRRLGGLRPDRYCCLEQTNLGGDQRQTHALQVAALMTENKVLLLRFGNHKLELDLLSQHGRAEGESMKGALRQLQHNHTHVQY